MIINYHVTISKYENSYKKIVKFHVFLCVCVCVFVFFKCNLFNLSFLMTPHLLLSKLFDIVIMPPLDVVSIMQDYCLPQIIVIEWNFIQRIFSTLSNLKVSSIFHACWVWEGVEPLSWRSLRRPGTTWANRSGG